MTIFFCILSFIAGVYVGIMLMALFIAAKRKGGYQASHD